MEFQALRVATASFFLAALGACGGGGGSAIPATPTSTTLTVTGTAATGLAIPGATVTGKCKVGTGTATTLTDGSYTLTVTDGQLPCVLQITNPVDGIKLHTVVFGIGSTANANITPLTEMATAHVLGSEPNVFFSAFDAAVATQKITTTAVQAAETDIGLVLIGTVDTTALGNFISTPLKAATHVSPNSGDVQDKLLDALKLKLSSTQIGTLATAFANNQITDVIKQIVVSMTTAPIANAGLVQSIVAGTTATLDGSGSSVGVGNTLTYDWTLISKPVGSAAVLVSQATVRPTLTTDVAGTYTVLLVVRDGKVASSASAFTSIVADANVSFRSTPPVAASPSTNSTPFNNEYWKIEYIGSDAGFCDALYVNQYGNSYTQGMCMSMGKVLGDFGLKGIIDINGVTTLNRHLGSDTSGGAIFRGALHLDGTGGGTWDIPNSASQGTWTATRYPGERTYSAPLLSNPDAGSFASGIDGLYGIWKRPTITNYPEFALILPNGDTGWQVTSPFGGFAKMFGTFLVQGSTWSLDNGSALYSSSSVQNVNASGTFIPKTRIVGSMSASTGKPVTLSFDSYAPENALALTLQDISGTYIGGGSLFLGSDGTVTGSTGDGQQGCKVRGKISEIFPGAKVNLFRAKITFYGPSLNSAACIQTQSGPDYDGYVFMQTTGSNRYLYSLLRPSLISVGSNPTIGMYSAYLVGQQIR